MTRRQEYMVEMIRRKAKENLFYNKEAYEFKTFEVKDERWATIVVFEIGQKNDEGTMASIFCRDRAQFFIGKNGGITYVNKKGTVKRLGRNSFYCACYEQNH